MYKEYFRLGEMPFSIAPDPRFLFMSDRHREAIAHLLYGVQGAGGIVLLTGEVGTGKTTICRTMLDQLPENIDVAFILNPRMSVEELLQTVCEEYHIDIAPGRTGIKAFVDAINTRLLDTNALGRRAILIIDEAQNLDPALLEQLRLLTNLETNTRKLLQIFLIGQPELQEMLARPEMRQVAQRVIARYHLTHLSQPEVKAYVAHRLTVSGASPSIFPDTLVKPLYQASGGVPRLINLICDRALLGTYVQGRQQVNAQTLRKAVKEILAVQRPQKPLRYRWAIIGVLLLSLAGTAIVTAPAFTGAASGWLATIPFAKLAAVVPNLPPAMTAQPASTIATPVATPQPTMPIEWPGNVARAESEALALQSLFKLYGIGFNPQSGRREDLCRQAEEHGMRCFAWHGGLSDLMLLDQPAVMRLSHVGGQEFSVTLVSLEPPVATLAIAGVERRVALTDLASLWLGQYLVIWKAPLGFRDVIKLNQRGPDVAWARRVLSAIDGGANDGSDLFDAELAQRVRAFQLTEGLQPVGFVGPKTVIRLNMRSGQIGPRLVPEKKG